MQPHRLGIVADIVARRGRLLWIIEVKTQFGLKVLQQAWRWVQYAHLVSIAVPFIGKYDIRNFGEEVMRRFGIGCIIATPDRYDRKIDIRVQPAFRRRVADHLITACLREEHKTFAVAGNNSASRFTPFQATCFEVRTRVNAKPGIPMKELMAGLRHHYSNDTSARACIRKWTEEGKISGVRIERDGKALRFYPGVSA